MESARLLDTDGHCPLVAEVIACQITNVAEKSWSLYRVREPDSSGASQVFDSIQKVCICVLTGSNLLLQSVFLVVTPTVQSLFLFCFCSLI